MSFPNVARALSRFNTGQTFRVLKKEAIDFELSETLKTEITFRGTMEPIPQQKLHIKPEGQRSWRWWTLWTTQNLNIDSVIIDRAGIQFRVMSGTDWSAAGYYEYELTQEPQ